MPGLRLLVSTLLLAVVLTGCGGDDSGDDRTEAPDVPVAVEITPLSVNVIDPGAEPLTTLRHDVEPGQTWQGDLNFNVDAGPTAVSVAGDIGLEVSSVDPDGTATVAYGLTDLDVVAGGRSTTDALDITGDLVVEPDRTVTSATIRSEGSAAADQVIEGALDPRLPALLFPQPAEPVGIGARWEVSGTISLLGTIVDFDATVDLAARQGTRFTLRVVYQLHQPDRGDLTLAGQGQMVGDTAQLGPVSGALALSGTILPPGQAEPQAAVFALDIGERAG